MSIKLAMSWAWIVFPFLAFVYLLQGWLRKKSKRLPPGPRRLPIIGNLHILGKFPHRDLHRLSNIHGPIMYMRFGFVPVVVVSSPQAAEQFLKTHDLVFASRPPLEAAKHISYDQKNMSFSPYGSYWRSMRKLCTLELLSNLKINSFKTMRKQELGLMIESLKEAACGRVAVDLSAMVSTLSADMSCLMVLGKKYLDREFDERGFKAVIQDGMHLGAKLNIGDYIPQLAALDLQGLTKRMKAVSKVFDSFFEKIIDEHVQSKDEKPTEDFVDTMLAIMNSQEFDFHIDRSNIKATILDMLSASMDTSATAVEWTLSELLKHPRVMKKVQNELEKVVGKERMVEESDLESLKYLDMVVKETFRLHPVAPLLLPHESMEDCTINGFHIPKKSRVMINAWAIGRDPEVWMDAEKFLPERFIEDNIDIQGHDFRLIPFGSGRRGCPGMQLGITVVRLVVAQLVHCFDLELPNDLLPTELDMTEEFGLTIPRSKHLYAIPTYRLYK